MSFEPVYNYQIISFDVENESNSKFDVIRYINMLIKASYLFDKVTRFYKLKLPEPESNNEEFIPFNNLSEEVCQQWIIHEGTTNEEFIKVKQEMKEELITQLNNRITIKPPPFNLI